MYSLSTSCITCIERCSWCSPVDVSFTTDVLLVAKLNSIASVPNQASQTVDPVTHPWSRTSFPTFFCPKQEISALGSLDPCQIPAKESYLILNFILIFILKHIEFQRGSWISGPSTDRKQSHALLSTIPHVPVLMMLVIMVVLSQYPHLQVVHSGYETGSGLHSSLYLRSAADTRTKYVPPLYRSTKVPPRSPTLYFLIWMFSMSFEGVFRRSTDISARYLGGGKVPQKTSISSDSASCLRRF